MRVTPRATVTNSSGATWRAKQFVSPGWFMSLPGRRRDCGAAGAHVVHGRTLSSQNGPVTGQAIPIDEQDRSLWDRNLIDEGVSILSRALSKGRVGLYQLQAAIAAVHDEARSPEETDWPQILALYDLLLKTSGSPVTRLNRAVAVAMVQMVLERDDVYWRTWRPMIAWAIITGCTPSADTFWRWSGTNSRLLQVIGRLCVGRPAHRRGTTSCQRLRGLHSHRNEAPALTNGQLPDRYRQAGGGQTARLPRLVVKGRVIPPATPPSGGTVQDTNAVV